MLGYPQPTTDTAAGVEIQMLNKDWEFCVMKRMVAVSEKEQIKPAGEHGSSGQHHRAEALVPKDTARSVQPPPYPPPLVQNLAPLYRLNATPHSLPTNQRKPKDRN